MFNLNDFLKEFVEMCLDTLGTNLAGVYLHGSAAMGCFNPDKSDIDVILITEKSPSKEEKLAFMREVVKMNAMAPKKGLELSIVRREFCKPFVYPTPYELHFSPAHLEMWERSPEEYLNTLRGTDKDLAAHFMILNRYGKVLYGEETNRIFGEVSRKDYIDSIIFDIENAENDIKTDPVYITLNLCRALAYVSEGLVLSKKDGGEWGAKALPEKHKAIVNDALSCYTSDRRMLCPEEAEEFAGFMLNEIKRSI